MENTAENPGLEEAGTWSLSPSRPQETGQWGGKRDPSRITSKSPQEREETSECFERLGREGEAAA